MAKKNEEAKPEDDFFSDKNIPESNWFAFEKIGDKIRGIVLDMFDKPSRQAGYPDQRVIVIRVEECPRFPGAVDTTMNVPLKKTSDYLMSRTNGLKMGDRFGAVFTKEIPPKIRGHHPAKSIQVYIQKDADKDLVAARTANEEFDKNQY